MRNENARPVREHGTGRMLDAAAAQSTSEDTRTLTDRQARRLLRTRPLSWPIARAVARLFYGEGR